MTRVTDIVINEIFYHPPEDRAGEFIELYHRGAGGVIPPQDYDALFEAGAAAVFGPGTVISEAAIKLTEKLAEHLGISLESSSPVERNKA